MMISKGGVTRAIARAFGRNEKLVTNELLGRTIQTRHGTVRKQSDYDDAWYLACARRAEIIFDIGSNIGYTELLALSGSQTRELVLVEANSMALSVAAENLIRNGLSARARFVLGFVTDRADQTAAIWTSGTGAAASRYKTHVPSASRFGEKLEVPTLTVDSLCQQFNVVPDMIKIDVEGAERDDRGRFHLLLQPTEWPYPRWLEVVRQSAPVESVA